MIPSGRLWVALCLLSLPAMLAGFMGGLWPVIVLADALLLLVAGVDFLLARRVHLEVRREVPSKLSVGVGNRFELHLHHRSGGAARVLIQDDLPDELSAEPMPLELTLPPHSRAKASYKATPAKRGKFELGNLNVRVRGPLGLMWHERRLPAAQAVAVYPDLRGASRLLLSGAALDLVNLGLRELRRDGRGSEFARLRDYAQGDSVREVDWKATARRTRPVTRVMESERSQTVLICVDAGRAMAAQVDGLTKLDHAVNAALFLAFVAVRNGDRVGLVVFADGVKAFLTPDAGRAQYRKIVDTLYSTKPSLTYVDHLELFRTLHARVTRRSLVCLFTDFLDEDQAMPLVQPLRRLARRHVPLCLSLEDTAITRLLKTQPVNPEDAFNQAAAAELLAERERLKAKIGRDGVHLVDVRPEELSLSAVNRYLEIKSRGLL